MVLRFFDEVTILSCSRFFRTDVRESLIVEHDTRRLSTVSTFTTECRLNCSYHRWFGFWLWTGEVFGQRVWRPLSGRDADVKCSSSRDSWRRCSCCWCCCLSVWWCRRPTSTFTASSRLIVLVIVTCTPKRCRLFFPHFANAVVAAFRLCSYEGCRRTRGFSRRHVLCFVHTVCAAC